MKWSVILFFASVFGHSNSYSQDSVAADLNSSKLNSDYFFNHHDLLNASCFHGEEISVSLISSYYTNSNAVSSDMRNTLTSANFIDDQLKQTILNDLQKRNFWGLDFYSSASFSKNFDSFLFQHSSFIFGVEHRNMIVAGFPENAAQLLLMGNGFFENDTAQLSPLVFNNLAYNKIKAGMAGSWETNGNFYQLGFTFSFLQGYHHEQVSVLDASLYTAPDGEFIDLNYSVTHSKSSPHRGSFFEPQGIGVGMDWMFSYNHDNKFVISFQASDIGYIEWHNGLVTSRDTMIHYEGIEVPNIFDLEDSLFSESFADSLQETFLGEEKSVSYRTPLPSSYEIAFTSRMEEMFFVTLGGMVRTNTPGFPLVYLKFNRYFKKDFSVGATLSYGEWGRVNIGAEVKKQIGPLHISIGSNALQGILAPKNSSGTSVWLNIATFLSQRKSL